MVCSVSASSIGISRDDRHREHKSSIMTSAFQIETRFQRPTVVEVVTSIHPKSPAVATSPDYHGDRKLQGLY